MFRIDICSNSESEIEEFYNTISSSVEGTKGLNENKGILISPIIKKTENGRCYFSIAVGEDGKNDFAIGTWIGDMEY